MVESGSDRRLIGSIAGSGLLPCCESWVAEQLLEEAKRGRSEAPRSAAGMATVQPEPEPEPEPERSGRAETRPDIRLI
jgi:hypothetical protein